jgi:hypothetical protein
MPVQGTVEGSSMVYQTFLRQCHGGTYTGIIRQVTHMTVHVDIGADAGGDL